MNANVVIAYPGFGDIEIEREILSAAGLEIEHVGNLDTEEAREAARQCDALMVTIQPVRAELIQSLERCRLICRVGTGLDAIEIAAATERGIWVTYAPDYSIDEVSTHAIALVLAQARGLPGLFGATRQGIWNSESGGILYRLSNQILGVVGCGRIGQATAAKGRGLGLKVLVYDPYVDAAEIEELGAQVVDLETVLAKSDYISLHVPLDRITYHMMSTVQFKAMKNSAVLINTCRGSVVDEAALVDALKNGEIWGAGLDVTEVEPTPPDNPLITMPNVVITPHLATRVIQSEWNADMNAVENAERIAQGFKPNWIVDPV